MKAGHEICDHGLPWTEHYRYTYEEEKEAIARSVAMIEELTGKKPVGFYAREPSPNTLRIVQELGTSSTTRTRTTTTSPTGPPGGMLILPYTPDVNDFHFQSPMHRFSNSSDFFVYLKDSFDVLARRARPSRR